MHEPIVSVKVHDMPERSWQAAEVDKQGREHLAIWTESEYWRCWCGYATIFDINAANHSFKPKKAKHWGVWI